MKPFMKKVLSFLMIFVFLDAESWAYPPVYPTTAADVAGTYAGVLVPSVPEAGANAASIGIFGIGIPSSTSSTVVISQGAAALFVNGAVYNATLTGVLDPLSNTLSSILEGVSSFSHVVANDGVAVTVAVYFYAQGNLTATLQAPPPVRGLAAGNGPGTAGAERLQGNATIDLYQALNGANGQPLVTGIISYSVSGFQQTSTYSIPAFQIVPASSGQVVSGG
jgi:hypothetical protein